MHVLDLTNAFVESGGDWRRWWATPYDSHPNADAHRLAAETLLPWLEQNGFITKLAASPYPERDSPPAYSNPASRKASKSPSRRGQGPVSPSRAHLRGASPRELAQF